MGKESAYNSKQEEDIAHIGSYCSEYILDDCSEYILDESVLPEMDKRVEGLLLQCYILGYASSFIRDPGSIRALIYATQNNDPEHPITLINSTCSTRSKIKYLFEHIECPVCGNSSVRYYTISAGDNTLICSKCASKHKVLLHPDGSMLIKPVDEDGQEEVTDVEQGMESEQDNDVIQEPDLYE